MALHSRRAKRMDSHHKRGRRVALNLVSLMDIFTILVFFLLVNSTEVETLPVTKGVSIPESTANQQPKRTFVVTVTPDSVAIDGQSVASAAEMKSSSSTIPALATALAQLDVGNSDDDIANEITIMGDKDVHFRLLRRVMATCAEAEFDRVSLAVLQKTVVPDA